MRYIMIIIQIVALLFVFLTLRFKRYKNDEMKKNFKTFNKTSTKLCQINKNRLYEIIYIDLTV